MEHFTVVGLLLGGLGLFFLGVTMITRGLRLAAGNDLRILLGRWTSSLGRGVVSGMMVTALVQSSSAVTVATIGFANAGLLTLRQACGVIYGANIGTTMTGWLVSIVGFGLKIEMFALPLIGLGALLEATGGRNQRGAIGKAMAGFGLFFIGLDFLRDAFTNLSLPIELMATADLKLSSIAVFVGLGFLSTVLTQSSSASIALIISACVGGAVPLPGAIAMVIGANVGTTSTSILSVIGATSNAKRVAAAHVIFNLITALIALFLLPMVFWLLENLSVIAVGRVSSALILAMFHTVFNVLGTLVMWPVTGRLAEFLSDRFRSREEDKAVPRYLDDTTLKVPVLALNAVTMELERVSGIVTMLSSYCLGVHTQIHDRRAAQLKASSDALIEAIYDFVGKLQREQLSDDVSASLHVILRTARYYSEIAGLLVFVAEHRSSAGVIHDQKLNEMCMHLYSAASTIFLNADSMSRNDPSDRFEDQEALMEQIYTALKKELISSAVDKKISIQSANHLLDAGSAVHRAALRVVVGSRGRGALYQSINMDRDVLKPAHEDV